MIDRCRPNAAYGKRGIAVCERWRTFANFLADMGERPLGFELDRVSPLGDYEPANCQWTLKRQNRQYRRTTKLTPDKRQTVLELRKIGLTRQQIADHLGVSFSCIKGFLSGEAWRPRADNLALPRPPAEFV